MSNHTPRIIPPNVLVEITCVVLQNRFLLRPSKEVNDLILGVLGEAQMKYAMTVCSVSVASSHFHLLIVPRDSEHMATFMGFVNGNIAKEIGGLHDWDGKFWKDRYHHVVVSDEEAAQVSRLEYLLAHGVKEGLVDRVSQWPGVHSAQALIDGQPLIGHWFDRTQHYAARVVRGEKDAAPAGVSGHRMSLKSAFVWPTTPISADSDQAFAGGDGESPTRRISHRRDFLIRGGESATRGAVRSGSHALRGYATAGRGRPLHVLQRFHNGSCRH